MLYFCIGMPSKGFFTMGKEYCADVIIDAWVVQDDMGEKIFFNDPEFFGNFTEAAPVTSDNPMLNDRNIYSIYLLCNNSKHLLEEIRAYSKICGVNYLQAKKKLEKGRNFIFKGNAYETRDILRKLSKFKVQYEVIPTYPHSYK